MSHWGWGKSRVLMPQDSLPISVSHAGDSWKGISGFNYTHYFREANHLFSGVASICYFSLPVRSNLYMHSYNWTQLLIMKESKKPMDLMRLHSWSMEINKKEERAHYTVRTCSYLFHWLLNCVLQKLCSSLS